MRFQVGDLVCGLYTDPRVDRIYKVIEIAPTSLRAVGHEQYLTLKILVADVAERNRERIIGATTSERNGLLTSVPEMLYLARIANGEPHVSPQVSSDVS